MRSLSPPPPLTACSRPLPCPRAFSSSPPPSYSPHIDRPRTKAQTTTIALHNQHHPCPSDQHHSQGPLHTDPSLQDLHMHLEQLHLHRCQQHQQGQQQMGQDRKQPATLGLFPDHHYHPYCFPQFPSSHYDTCDINYNISNGQQHPSHHYHHQQHQQQQYHQHPTSAMLAVDITTIQGLVLYTLYFLHRLRFFRRWRDTHRIALSHRRAPHPPTTTSWSPPSAIGFTSSSTLSSADTSGGTRANALDQRSHSGLLDETTRDSGGGTLATAVVNRSTATFEPRVGDEAGDGAGERAGPHTTTTKYGDTPSLFNSSPSSSTFASSSSISFSSLSSLPASAFSSISSLLSNSMLPYIFSSAGAMSATTRTTTHTSSSSTSTTLVNTVSSSTLTSSPSCSINTYLPPEILVQIFRHLAATRHTRTLTRCTLVCHSWYLLVGPLIWKSPRVLWSQHWSRFHPIIAMSTATRTSAAASSATTSPSSSSSSSSTATAAATETTTAIPRQSGLSLAGPLNYGRINNHDDEHEARRSSNFVQDSSADLGDGEGGGNNPLSLQLQLQQILLQQTQQRQLTWLYLWQTDRIKALASDRLHDQDRQELEEWLVWKKREKARRLRELRRRRQELAVRQKRQRDIAEEGQGMAIISPAHQYRPQEGEEGEDLRGRMIRNATSRTYSRSRSRSRSARRSTTTTTTTTEGRGTGVSMRNRRRRRRRRRRVTIAPTTTNMITSDEDDDDEDDNGNEDGSSEDSDSEDDVDGPIGFDSDDGVLLSDSSDYEASDDETPLMKLVSRFDALHAWISTSSATALSALQDVATVPVVILPSTRWRNNRTLLQQEQQQQLSRHQLQQPTRLPFKEAIAKIRRRQAAKDCRRRLAEIQPRDGLPASLPLRTCGQWIQVINLQQEMPYHQRVMTQSFMQHPTTPARGTTLRSRAIQLLQQQQQEQHRQQGLMGGGGRYGFLGSVFRYLTRQSTPGALEVGTALEPERLLSRRDFVNDCTVKTILDHCPGLCKLTLSECDGITDRSLDLIRDSACVAGRTLISLHLAGCSQITDRGLLGLLGNTRRTSSHRSSPSSSGSSSSSCASSSSTSPFTTSFSSVPTLTPTSQLRLESLDFAGCYQISDKGLIPLLKQCGSRLVQLRVSDCENITSASVMALANHCPLIQWLDLCRTGVLTEECLILLAERCTDLEWLNLARVCPGLLDSSPESGILGDNTEVDNGGVTDNHADVLSESEQEEEEEEEEEGKLEVDNEKASVSSNSDGDVLVKEESTTESQQQQEQGQEHPVKEDSITDRALALLCESCPKLQLLDLSYISTISNGAMESLSETAKSLVCLTIIGCPGITSQSLLYLARLRNNSGKLGCITMGDALGISERDIEQIMQGTLSGWQKSLVDEMNLGEILGRSWDE